MADLQDTAIQFAETVQTASINHNPSVERDLAPETSVDFKQPVTFDHSADHTEELDEVEEDEIPLSILRPVPEARRQPPHLQLPDLRFEQSYLKSIGEASDWKMVAYVTIKDQVLMPLLQGMVWTLVVAGWRHSNSTAKFSGQTVGARIRRWWWGVNNWTVPDDSKSKWFSGSSVSR